MLRRDGALYLETENGAISFSGDRSQMTIEIATVSERAKSVSRYVLDERDLVEVYRYMHKVMKGVAAGQSKNDDVEWFLSTV